MTRLIPVPLVILRSDSLKDGMFQFAHFFQSVTFHS